jgi:aromatic-L-amino-acid decarboxylase
MTNFSFRHWARRAADWGVDYRETISQRPVRPRIEPGAIARALPASPPEAPEPMDAIFADFERLIVPGMTHWQHPRFFAYFPANAAPVSVVAEHLVNGLAAQCMLWQTSPAATELESVVLDWLRQALGLPASLKGVIQDSASSATLAAILTMRERALQWSGNREGLSGKPPVRIYASSEVHSSIDRAVWFAGIGEENLVRIPIEGGRRGLVPEALDAAIIADKAAGRLPAGIVACVGGTSAGASDDIAAVSAIAKRHGLYLHVDAAWAGSAMICPELRHWWAGIEDADSLVLNPHKWLGAQFDCSAHFIAEPDALVRTLAIRPEYLMTHGRDGIVNYSEWSLPLGRRFRALKLWFLLRAEGLESLRSMIRNHVAWTERLAGGIRRAPELELVTEPMLALLTFRLKAATQAEEERRNLALVDAINNDGRIYLTQTRIDGRVAIRLQVGGWTTSEEDVRLALDVIREMAGRIG